MIIFEWCPVKERRNIEKHRLDLNTVKRVFADPFRIARYDAAHSGLEDRWQTLGMADGVLCVVYTERGSKIRIITARKATSEEKRIYYGTQKRDYWFIP